MSDIITSCFFTTKNDPQRNFRLPTSTFDPIKNWYNSIMEVGLKAILFYDILDDEIVNTYSNENVKFIKDESYTEQSFCAADHRWTLYKEYFKNNFYDNIFATDCTDVLVKLNPFNDIKFLINRDNFFIGREYSPPTNWLNDWMVSQLNYCYPNDPDIITFVYPERVLNCGIVGGTYENFMKIASLMSDEILRINPTPESCRQKNIQFTIDMGVMNYIGYKHLGGENIISDEPVHSAFKLYQETRDDVWFIHK